jgi:hypothetical protein
MPKSEQHQVSLVWWRVLNIQSCEFDETYVDEKRRELDIKRASQDREPQPRRF